MYANHSSPFVRVVIVAYIATNVTCDYMLKNKEPYAAGTTTFKAQSSTLYAADSVYGKNCYFSLD